MKGCADSCEMSGHVTWMYCPERNVQPCGRDSTSWNALPGRSLQRRIRTVLSCFAIEARNFSIANSRQGTPMYFQALGGASSAAAP